MIQVYDGSGNTNQFDPVQLVLFNYVNGVLLQCVDEDIDAEMKDIFGKESYQKDTHFVIKHENRTVIARVQDGEIKVAS